MCHIIPPCATCGKAVCACLLATMCYVLQGGLCRHIGHVVSSVARQVYLSFDAYKVFHLALYNPMQLLYSSCLCSCLLIYIIFVDCRLVFCLCMVPGTQSHSQDRVLSSNMLGSIISDPAISKGNTSAAAVSISIFLIVLIHSNTSVMLTGCSWFFDHMSMFLLVNENNIKEALDKSNCPSKANPLKNYFPPFIYEKAPPDPLPLDINDHIGTVFRNSGETAISIFNTICIIMDTIMQDDDAG